MILIYAVLYYLKTSGILEKSSEIIVKKFKVIPQKIHPLSNISLLKIFYLSLALDLKPLNWRRLFNHSCL